MFQLRFPSVAHVIPVVLAGGLLLVLAPNVPGHATAGEKSGADNASAPKALSAFDRAAAFHWRVDCFETYFPSSRREPIPQAERIPNKVVQVMEGWGLRGVGRRIEVRRATQLVSVTVETPRWRFVWQDVSKRVAAYPSSLMKQRYLTISSGHPEYSPEYLIMASTREEVIRYTESLKGSYVSQKDRLDGKEVEKITTYLLAEPATDFDTNIHFFRPEIHEKLLKSPNAVYRSRTYWFDPKTNLLLRRDC